MLTFINVLLSLFHNKSLLVKSMLIFIENYIIFSLFMFQVHHNDLNLHQCLSKMLTCIPKEEKKIHPGK